MDRKTFISTLTGITMGGLFMNFEISALKNIVPEELRFADDGQIPNNTLPLLIYHHVLEEEGTKGAEWLENRFLSNNWSNSWRWGVYPFHHYHSNTHEVLGVFSGSALLHLGGENGRKIEVHVGDVIVIPAGTGHKKISSSDNFTVVGAYPNGLNPDLLKGDAGERPQADRNIAAVLIPESDPIFGKGNGLLKIWK